MKVWAARDQGPSSAGTERHFAPFWCRQRVAEIVRRKSRGGVLPLGLHASISGSSIPHCASVSIVFLRQEEQNACSQKRFKCEQAVALQLRFAPDMGFSGCGLVSASPEW
jgi:hypothetical protein